MAEETNDKNIRAVVTFKDDAASLSSTNTASPLLIPQEKLATFEEAARTPSAHSTLTALADEVASTSTVQESVLADRGRSFDSEASGTIIRETKRKRFRLLPAMVEASKQWFEKQKKSYDTYRHPYHPIAKADVRKEVIEAAVAKSAVAPREDFQMVAERLKEADRKPVRTTLTLKAKAEVQKPQWSSLIEENKPEAPETQEVASVVPPQEPTPLQEEREKQSPQIGFTSEQNTTFVSEVVTPVVTPLLEEQIETVAVPVEINELPEASVPQEIQPVAQTVQESTPLTAPLPTVSRPRVHQERNVRIHFDSRYLIALFLLFAIASGVGLSFLIFKTDDVPQQKTEVYTIPSGIAAPQEGFALRGTREDVLLDIAERLQVNNGVVHLYATFALQDGTRKPATSEQLFSVLNFRTGASFDRNVSELTFGGLGTAPFMLMKTQSFDTAFAGMLAWEKTMSADLSPLFGAPVVATFDPSARTDTQVRDAFFKDTIASNKNVRLLLDEEGKDRLVYTFVNQNTILITTTRTALDALLPLVR